MYQKGFGCLGHKLALAEEDESFFIKPQHSGICSWKVLQAFILKTFCNPISYKKYVFELKLLTLLLFFRKCEKQCDTEDCMLIKEATVNLLRSTAKLYDENPETKTLDVYKVLEEILDNLKYLQPINTDHQLQQECIKTRLPYFSAISSNVEPLVSSMQKEGAPILFPSIEPDNFLTNVKRMLAYINLLDNDSKIFQIQNFVRALPVPNPDLTKDNWQKLFQEDLQESLFSILYLIELYGDLCLKHPPFFPSQQNTALSLLAIAHCLAMQIDQQQSGELANYGIWDAFFNLDRRFFTCFEPQEQQRR